MWVIQLEETFESQKAVDDAQKKVAAQPGYLGGRILKPAPCDPWKLQAFFRDTTIGVRTGMPDGLSLVYIPEYLEAYYGIK